MGRKEQVKRIAEQKWEILRVGLKSGNVPETVKVNAMAKRGGGTRESQ